MKWMAKFGINSTVILYYADFLKMFQSWIDLFLTYNYKSINILWELLYYILNFEILNNI